MQQFLILFFLLLSLQLQASVTATVDSRQINFNQSLQFNLRSDNAAGKSPNLTVLKRQFRVVGNSKVSRPYSKNGIRKQKTLWFFILRPKISGTLQIPAITINGERSQPIKIKVIALKKKKSKKRIKRKPVVAHNVLVKATINKSKLYPNEILIYTLTINYPDNSYKDFKATAPFIPGAIVLPLKKPELENITQRSKPRVISRQTFAIFADQMALYNIEPAQVSFQQINARPTAKSILLKANTLHFEIIPKGNQTSLGYWLPSQNIELTQHWEGLENPTQGSIVTRSIELKVQGVNSDILPLVSSLTNANATIILKDVQVENIIENGQLFALRTEKTEFSFDSAKLVTVAPIDIHWWNTRLNQARISSLEARTIKISNDVVPNKASQETLHNTPLISKKKQATTPLISESSLVEKPESARKLLSIQQMNWAIALLFILLVATTFGWLFSARKRKTKPF